MTPGAVKRAALEEDGRPDAGAIMDGETLDVEYGSVQRFVPLNGCNISHISWQVKQ
jgi:hypothetical protein